MAIDLELAYQEGYKAGLADPFAIEPYDGRTKAGKQWWSGFLAGDAERCAANRNAAPADKPKAS